MAQRRRVIQLSTNVLLRGQLLFFNQQPQIALGGLYLTLKPYTLLKSSSESES